MNKKVGFIFLVLLCSLNLMIFSQERYCPSYTVGNGLVLKAQQVFDVDKSIYKYSFKITVQSTTARTIVINSVDTTQRYGYKFLTSPLAEVLGPRGRVSFIYLTDEGAVGGLPDRYIKITAQDCN